ncbi:hypothetical protein JKP88DRAFT_136887, partial [Tribonema minus]
GTLDFGRVRVGDAVRRSFRLVNRGKYDIAYALRFRRAAAAALFALEPAGGALAPGAAVEIGVTLHAAAEVHLRGNLDLRCTITEPRTGEAVEEFAACIDAAAVWPRLRALPSRGVDFGAVAFNAGAPQTRAFELKNEGDFECAFALCAPAAAAAALSATAAAAAAAAAPGAAEDGDARAATEAALYHVLKATPAALLAPAEAEALAKWEAAAAAAAAAPAVSRAAGAAKGRKPTSSGSEAQYSVTAAPDAMGMLPGTVTIGQFTIGPYAGTIQPGQSVTFQPAGSKGYREVIELRAAGAQPLQQQQQQSTYELVGESCVPGIETSDWHSIFEEQVVVPSLDDAAAAAQHRRHRGRAAAAAAAAAVPPSALFAEDQRLLSFGSVATLASGGGGGGSGGSGGGALGVCERVKIVNDRKVPCSVRFEIRPPTDAAAVATAAATGGAAKGKKASISAPSDGGAGSAQGEAAFTVQPAQWDIPPHEFRYVTVHFRPLEMRAYRGRFVAAVTNADAAAAAAAEAPCGRLEFLLAGQGTMPVVTVERPLARDTAGAVTVDFGEVAAERARRVPLVLFNGGTVPAFCIFELRAPPPPFAFAHSGGSVELAPGERRELEVVFQPRAAQQQQQPAQQLSGVLRMSIMHNPFGATAFALRGACVARDVAFEELPGGSGSDAQGSRAALAAPSLPSREAPFWLRNAAPAPVRFAFAPHAHFAFRPALGHIPAGGVKEVVAAFRPAGVVRYADEPLQLTTHRVAYADTAPAAAAAGGGDGSAQPSAAAAAAADADWDEAQETLRPATDDELVQLGKADPKAGSAKANGAAAAKKPAAAAAKGKGAAAASAAAAAVVLRLGPVTVEGVQMVYATSPEPACTVHAESKQTRVLRCSAVADVARYELRLGSGGGGGADGAASDPPGSGGDGGGGGRAVTFRPTAMFQACTHEFTVRNPAMTRLDYAWLLSNMRTGGGGGGGGALLAPPPCPFHVEPASGAIAPGAEQVFKLRFAPVEVDDYAYRLSAAMPALPEGA